MFPIHPTRVGGIVLCGGKSSRMGRPKAWLPFGNETMLQRVVRLLGEVVQPIVVVAARDQSLPPLPDDVLVARDEREAQGPLEGLRIGLGALQDRVSAAYATSCDVPLLSPAFVSRMIAEWEDSEAPGCDVAVPVEEEAGKLFHHPLAAVYRASVVEHIDRLIAAGRSRPVFLYELVATRRVPVDRLREVDPELRSLRNLNHPEDYQRALDEFSSLAAEARLRNSVDETSSRNSDSAT